MLAGRPSWGWPFFLLSCMFEAEKRENQEHHAVRSVDERQLITLSRRGEWSAVR